MTSSSLDERQADGREVRVNGERGVAYETGPHGWVRVEFPDRTDGFASGGWVDPKNVEEVAS
jgi:hypothetical protein